MKYIEVFATLPTGEHLILDSLGYKHREAAIAFAQTVDAMVDAQVYAVELTVKHNKIVKEVTLYGDRPISIADKRLHAGRDAGLAGNW